MSFKTASRLKELRLHLCPKTSTSAGVRSFLEKRYVDLKKKNPTLPILVRECDGVEPRLWGRYEKGAERSVSLANMDLSKVESNVNEFLT